MLAKVDLDFIFSVMEAIGKFKERETHYLIYVLRLLWLLDGVEIVGNEVEAQRPVGIASVQEPLLFLALLRYN